MTKAYEWDPDKNIKNIVKHDVSFEEALEAFIDSKRLIFYDAAHSHDEERYFCIGKVARGIITVRFTYRKKIIRIIGAAFWRKGKKLYFQQKERKS